MKSWGGEEVAVCVCEREKDRTLKKLDVGGIKHS